MNSTKETSVGVLCCAANPVDRLVATGDSVGVVCLWQPETAKQESTLRVRKENGVLDYQAKITACSFSLPESSNPVLATGNDQSVIRLWDYRKRALLVVFDKHLLPIVGIHFINGERSDIRILR